MQQLTFILISRHQVALHLLLDICTSHAYLIPKTADYQRFQITVAVNIIGKFVALNYFHNQAKLI